MTERSARVRNSAGLLSLDASQRKRIAERYAAGVTMAELAREYDCGEATIWRALR